MMPVVQLPRVLRAMALLALAAAAVPLRADAQDEEPTPALTEKITDVSPDGRFAMRISYDAELNRKMIGANQGRADEIYSQTMYRIELVGLPSGTALLNLMADEDNLGGGANFEGLRALWSADSKWFAYYWTYPRVGYTTVYRLAGQKFQRMNKPEQLSVPAKGDVRNEYISPERWLKPGVLELKQIRIYRDAGWDDRLKFVARFDRPGKFKVLSKKSVPMSDE